VPDPVFIVGVHRSGTTHLGNLLAASGQFGYVSPIAAGLPWELLTLGTWLRPPLEKTIPEDRLIDRVRVKGRDRPVRIYEPLADGSHSFNDWNSTPPTDAAFWGIEVWIDED